MHITSPIEYNSYSDVMILDHCQDHLVDKIYAVATACLDLFWSVEEQLVMTTLPLHNGKYGQYDSAIIEYTRRFFVSAFGAFASLPLLAVAAAGCGFTGLANSLSCRGYSYLLGDYTENKALKLPKLLHLNACMFPGSLPIHFGGLPPANQRYEQLVELINANDADLLFLCECNRSIAQKLAYDPRIKAQYSHLMFNIGLNTMGLEACYFIAYRGRMATAPKFKPFDVQPTNRQAFINKGYCVLESSDYCFIMTHLDADSSEIRKLQIR